jgi:hypothetical protein
MLSNAVASDGRTTPRALARIRHDALANAFVPRGTVGCHGEALFRTRAARDAACLFDLDSSVIAWICLPELIVRNRQHHVPDFAVERASGLTLVDVIPAIGPLPPKWTAAAVEARGCRYETILESCFKDDFRLDNARDLLRYVSYDVSLGDRVRLLAFLDEHGPAPLATCMSVLGNMRDPVGAIASLALRLFVEIELDQAPLGPDSIVSRLRA